METKDITEIVLKIVGPVDPIGETNTDNSRFDNLKVLCELTENLVWIVDEIGYKNKDSYQYSVKRAGAYAFDFIEKKLNIKE
jgi:hypothetical protein